MENGSTDRWRRNTNANTATATLPKSEDIDDPMSYDKWRTDWMSLRKGVGKMAEPSKELFKNLSCPLS